MPQTALLIIDMLNPLRFAGGRELGAQALPAARAIARLRNRFREAACPVVYVNDNFKEWNAEFSELVEACQRETSRGARLAQLLAPGPDDYYILKPEQSGFHSTPLHILLRRLEVGRLVLTGIAGDGCVLATATDANMYKYSLSIPADCIACRTPARQRAVLNVLRASLEADLRPSRRVRIRR